MKLPEQFVSVIALLNFNDMGLVPAIGFIAETIDTGKQYFHVPLFGGRGYDVSLIVKWDYLDEIAPGYCIPGGHKNGTRDAESEK